MESRVITPEERSPKIVSFKKMYVIFYRQSYGVMMPAELGINPIQGSPPLDLHTVTSFVRTHLDLTLNIVFRKYVPGQNNSY